MKLKDIFRLTKNHRKTGALTVYAATHNGSCHEDNEDDYYINGTVKGESVTRQLRMRVPADLLAEICDGMGGEEKGGLASALAVKHTAELHQKLKAACVESFTDEVNAYVSQVNNAICDELCVHDGCRSGSTFAMVYIRDGVVHAYSLGDSRIYLYSDGELKQVSQDHTLAMKKYQTGIYTLEEAQQSPDSHKLTLFLGVDTRKVGLNATVYPQFPWKQGMKLLLCSDGLYDMCTEQEIISMLSEKSENCAVSLVRRAVSNGGMDNVTCIVIQ